MTRNTLVVDISLSGFPRIGTMLTLSGSSFQAYHPILLVLQYKLSLQSIWFKLSRVSQGAGCGYILFTGSWQQRELEGWRPHSLTLCALWLQQGIVVKLARHVTRGNVDSQGQLKIQALGAHTFLSHQIPKNVCHQAVAVSCNRLFLLLYLMA